MTTMTAPAGQAGKPGQPAPLGPFRGGTQPTVIATGYTQTVTLSAATQALPTYQIKPTNLLRCIYIEVKATAAGNAATVAFQADAPLNVFSSLNFADAGGTPVVGPFDSYALNAAMKYFGYFLNGDARQNAVFSATTGSGASGGSFTVVFRIPVEAVARTGLGALQNQSTNSPLTLDLTVNTSAAIYSTAPTAAPTIVTTLRLGGYWDGNNGAYSPTPKAFGSTQYVNRASIPALNGASQFQLPNVGLGNPVRNIAFLNYATGGARAGSGTFPDPFEIDFKGNRLRQSSILQWQYDMSEDWELSGAIDTGNGLDTGVFVQNFTKDFGTNPGAELGLGYLSTAVGDELQVIGTWGASSTLYELVNFVAVNGAPSAVQGMV